MAVSVGDLLLARFRFYDQTEAAYIVRHYRVSAVAGASRDEQQIAESLFTTFAGIFPPVIAALWDFTSCTVQKLRPLPIGAAQVSTAASTPGGRAGDILPAQTCGLISLRTALAGRANRGRSYIPRPVEGDNTANGNPAALYLGALVGVRDGLIASRLVTNGVDSATLLPVIYHRLTGTSTDITAGIVRGYWATQRRRSNQR